MARILIVEDHPINRELLATILHGHGHQVIEATDGEDGLSCLADARPDLVISDILMPTLDGYEFVRRLREHPELKATPVIFYTATYHEREARALANQCGVFDILTKPSEPDVILATVDRALASNHEVPGGSIDRETFDRDHLGLVNAVLTARIASAEETRQRMSDLVNVAHHVASERDPRLLLQRTCMEARQLTLAQHAVTGLLSEDGLTAETVFTSGFESGVAASLLPPSIGGSIIGTVVDTRQPVRTRNPSGRPEALGLPADHPRVLSILSVPIASPQGTFGWLSLRNKLGADEFTELDECTAVTIGAVTGLAYENAVLRATLDNPRTPGESDLPPSSAFVQLIREEERAHLARALHDRMGQALTGLKMDLHWLRAQLQSPLPPPTAQVTGKLASMLEQVQDTLGSFRRIAAELRPAVLDEHGLIAAIEALAKDSEDLNSLPCRVRANRETVSLDSGRSTLLFFIVKEALANVVRHAQATLATIDLKVSAKRLVLSIADDGQGISERDLKAVTSLGLTGMQERAALLGGTLEIAKRRPSGTLVKIIVPLPDKRK